MRRRHAQQCRPSIGFRVRFPVLEQETCKGYGVIWTRAIRAPQAAGNGGCCVDEDTDGVSRLRSAMDEC